MRFVTTLVLFLTVSISSLFGQTIPSDDASIAAGKKLFSLNCKSCHAINKQVVGPALAGVTSKHELSWLLQWIKNAPEMIASGDDQAVALYAQYKSAGMMNAFASFSETDILSILAYINTGGETPPPPGGGDKGGEVVQTAGTDSSSTYNIILGVIVLVLLLIVAILIILSSILIKVLKKKEEDGELEEDDKEFINQKTDWKKSLTNPIFVGVASVIILLVTLYVLITQVLYGIGVSQGYAPKQPIAFSHKIHAGQMEIDCQYCHTGVRKSKNANIPSPNICMNCHSQIKTESPEIKKIHKAIGYNAETGEYSGETKPIEWVRIHNLPDLAYFNHSQHAQVGNLQCETCHGEVKEMEVVYQYAPLTMGWCVNCHRETQVNAKGNDYYDKLLEIHESKYGDEPMKVENIGGTECAKCHY